MRAPEGMGCYDAVRILRVLNLTGFAGVSSASYSVDQTGYSTFRFVRDRPPCSYPSRESAVYRWLMPLDPRGRLPIRTNGAMEDRRRRPTRRWTNNRSTPRTMPGYPLEGGSHASLGLHAAFHDVDHDVDSLVQQVCAVGKREAR